MCTEDQKIRYGCFKDHEETVWKHEFCPYCLGRSENCFYCNGEDEIVFYRCVRKSVGKMSRLIRYYLEYRKYGVYPDGRGRLFQPIKLLNLFDILENLFNRQEENEIKAEYGNRDKSKTGSTGGCEETC